MSQDKIESRRAFMKKLGKLAGAAAVAAPFMAMATKEAAAAPDEDNPESGVCSWCTGHCNDGCKGTCSVSCISCTHGVNTH